MSDKPLTIKEELFCQFLAITNNRITAMEKAGYCSKIVNGAKGRKYTQEERFRMSNQASAKMKDPRINNRVKELIQEKINYLNESGVLSELEVLRKLSDIVRGCNQNSNSFVVQQCVSASKELLAYYKDVRKILGDKLENDSKDNKTFIVEYVKKDNEDVTD